jgi:C4-dicarboxylate-specific signal transduction histidine kinase
MDDLSQLVPEPGSRRSEHDQRFKWLTGAKLTLGAAGVVVGLVWIVAGVLVWQSRRDAIEDWKVDAVNTSLTVAAYTRQTLGAADLVLHSIQDWVSEAEIQSEEEFRQIMSERRYFDAMHDRAIGLPQIAIVSIAARNGDIINLSTQYPPPPANLVGREAFDAQVAPTAPPVSLSMTQQGSTTGKWTFYLSRRVQSKTGELLGVILVGLDETYISYFFSRITIGDGSSLALFRSDGALLASSLNRPELLGKRYDNAASLRMIAQGHSGTAELTRTSSFLNPGDRDGRIVAPREVEGFPAFIRVTMPEKVVLARWSERNYIVAAVALLLTMFIVYAAMTISRLAARAQSATRAISERRLLAALLDTPAALCAVLDGQANILYSNERFREAMETKGDPKNAFRNPALSGAARVITFAAGELPDRSVEVDLDLALSGGRTRFMHFSISRQSLPGLGQCAIMVGHDETERRNAQQSAAQTVKMAMLGDLTSGIAHELSQPLNVIRIAAQTALLGSEEGEELQEDDGMPKMTDVEFRSFAQTKFKRIVKQVDRGAAIISQMRIFGRAPAGAPAVFDARDACRSAITLFGHGIRRSGITLREELGDEALPVAAHRSLLEQVILSLLMNARDALKDSSQSESEIELGARKGPGDRILLRIADNGPGVPATIRERIFEPFFTTKPTGQGTGLSLAMAFGIIRDAGGTLSLLPNTKGAAFEIDLPARYGADMNG